MRRKGLRLPSESFEGQSMTFNFEPIHTYPTLFVDNFLGYLLLFNRNKNINLREISRIRYPTSRTSRVLRKSC